MEKGTVERMGSSAALGDGKICYDEPDKREGAKKTVFLSERGNAGG